MVFMSLNLRQPFRVQQIVFIVKMVVVITHLTKGVIGRQANCQKHT